jgi:predicted CopG family antitoxin
MNNSTTIQIKKDTLTKLKALKKELHAFNYDEVISYLIQQEQNVPDSMFGFLKGRTKSYSPDEDEEDHEL